ncbi:MAG TPA: 5-(carboxyamino)imidazole ribonucleotide mutase [Dehalococcoidia bacterium]|jgi:5-(carboxyamino)imidazole ribonucleotide mutase|nr:5-(carboxyamino)imidazole ribonucleotide mutase [Dehalococcoidia bacterium]
MANSSNPLVAIIMGSKSDWPDVMSAADKTLEDLGIPHESLVMSAHRTPDRVLEYAESAESRGIQVLIAGAGGAAHLAGVIAAKTQLPVLAVPIASTPLNGLDSLLAMVQMPGGIPVATLAIGRPGATNAAILAAEILALSHADIREKLRAFRARQTQNVLENPDPRA